MKRRILVTLVTVVTLLLLGQSLSNAATLDRTPPTAPASLTASNIATNSVTLTWTKSSDAVGVTGYIVYKNSVAGVTVAGLSTQISGLTANTKYSFQVRARDKAGNVSAPSPTRAVTTLPIHIPTAHLSLAGTTGTFGDVTLSTTKDVSLSVTNDGDAATTAVTATIAGAAFTIQGPVTPAVIAAGAHATIAVRFTAPAATGPSTGTLTLTATAGGVVTLPLSGNSIPVAVIQANLLPNPSLETANGAAPANWAADNGAWDGTVAAMTYDTGTAIDGTRAVTATVTKYVAGGDPEWMPDAFATPAGQTKFSFQDSYRSSVGTEVDAYAYNASGQATYVYGGNLAATPLVVAGTQGGSALTQDSYQWKRSDVSIVVPAGTVALQVWQSVNGVGFLQTDAYSVSVDNTAPIVPPPPGGELVFNPGFEQANGTVPAGWSQDGWGTNTAKFTWSTDAHTGSRSARVDMSARTDGDAKWDYMPGPVTGGNYYQFTDWYKSDADSQVSLGYYMADGSMSWSNLNLAIPASPTGWTQYKAGFIVPKLAVRAFFAHVIATNGFLETDDYSMLAAPNPPGFTRPLVTLTFDDGSPSQFSAMATLDTFGFKATDYVPTGDMVTPQNPGGFVWSAAQIKSVAARGHEIGGHTVTHPDLTLVSPAQLHTEVAANKATLEGILGHPITSFATPYGSYNSAVIAELKADGYATHRSVDTGFNTADDLNPWNVHVQNMLATTTNAEFQGWVDAAKAGNYFLVIVYHEIVNGTTGDPEDAYNTTPADFLTEMNIVKNSGVTVKTMHDALLELLPQVK